MASDIYDTKNQLIGLVVLIHASIQQTLNTRELPQRVIGLLIPGIPSEIINTANQVENGLVEMGYTRFNTDTGIGTDIEIFDHREFTVDQTDATILCFKSGYPIGIIKRTVYGTRNFYQYSANEIKNHRGYVGARCFPNEQVPAQQSSSGGGKTKRSTPSVMGDSLLSALGL